VSSKAARNWFRSYLVAQVPSVPYVDTVNRAPDPSSLPDVWFTLEFSNASEQRLTLGVPALFREFGVVDVVVLGLSGRGDDIPVDTAELFRSALQDIRLQIPVTDSVGGNGDLRIDAAEPPNTDATESGNWFLASVSCAYTLDVVRGA
jgi:hypothetical protein